MGNGNVTLRTHAHQVIDVQPDSPAAKCGLRDLDDFIIRLDGRLLMDLSPEEMQKMVVVSSAPSHRRPVRSTV